MPTIRQIAREAGVSVGTVSNVLNNYAHVSEGVRQRVRGVIERLDYRPSSIARSLSTRKTRTLGLIISLNPTPFYTDLAQGAVEAARAAGSGLMVVAVDYDAHDLLAQVESLLRQWVDGIFIATQPAGESWLDQLPELNIPLVIMDRGQASSNQKVGMVGFDWQAGAYAATRHLVDLGHRRIGYVGGIPGRSSSTLRERGYLNALQDAGLPYDPGLVREGDFFTESGRIQARELLLLPERPSALFLANDLMALGAYQAAAELDLRIPEDLSIVGVDNVFFTPYLSPPLTTVTVPTQEAGRTGIRMLLEPDATGAPIPRVILRTGLVVRQSTRSVSKSEAI
jgi:DNA-binding LacI/PurR family transcriptional regulator